MKEQFFILKVWVMCLFHVLFPAFLLPLEKEQIKKTEQGVISPTLSATTAISVTQLTESSPLTLDSSPPKLLEINSLHHHRLVLLLLSEISHPQTALMLP
ncbi:uncharacterized protein MONOS_15707 [Monocercomonoides exilis]|uniref:uncharacterized protein n=1 Tax=Monocercomonoides exilis TaxID=2049356 RepID=UPI00355A6D49|nr:hypothetical protein MONOS_15707 [Monocercomonoides exilis]|eukprot:MONOS_15707.1-p1 / transcript=MONOS_15707.1 / gene=MONOS_15707 / organism=Monocercomonoides_exilis_PA203 / gene_product=unspecified product / transcript_product=unspecified product / location=Mono_scaffold01319:4298-4763(-) / protein_length=100 / sequence_SO=supercontig / SO=protein_coding / is_pseudo=false